MNKIVIELSKEDRALLGAVVTDLEIVIDLLKGKNAPQSDGTEPAKEMNKKPEKPQESASQAAPAFVEAPTAPPWDEGVPAPEVHPEPQPQEVTTYSREDVQRKVVELCAAGKKVQVTEIVYAYADRVSNIPEDKLDEAMGKLIALEG